MRIPGKGRGLIATQELPRGTIVIINTALVSGNHSLSSTKTTVTSTGNHTILRSDQVMLRSKTVQLACRDPLSASILLGLDDNNPLEERRRVLPLVALRDMQQLLSTRVLPLLPSAAAYFPATEKEQISATFVQRVCEVNSHGYGDHILSDSASNLFPVASLLNHSRNPNCDVMPLSLLQGLGFGCAQGQVERAQLTDKVTAVITSGQMSVGEELTVRYHGDDGVVKQKWGL